MSPLKGGVLTVKNVRGSIVGSINTTTNLGKNIEKNLTRDKESIMTRRIGKTGGRNTTKNLNSRIMSFLITQELDVFARYVVLEII